MLSNAGGRSILLSTADEVWRHWRHTSRPIDISCWRHNWWQTNIATADSGIIDDTLLRAAKVLIMHFYCYLTANGGIVDYNIAIYCWWRYWWNTLVLISTGTSVNDDTLVLLSTADKVYIGDTIVLLFNNNSNDNKRRFDSAFQQRALNALYKQQKTIKLKYIWRGFCTLGPYFWWLCAFSQQKKIKKLKKIKQLWAKYPRDLVRNIPRS